MLVAVSASFLHAQQPKPTARAIVEEIKKQVGIEWQQDTVDTFKAGNPATPVVRVVGESEMKVTKVGLSPGAAGFERETDALERDDVQVLMVGETREWETVEYAADAVTEHRNKALIVIGHIPSEQPGMQECSSWLRAFVKDVPIEFVPTKQPFWTVSEKK